MDSGAVLSLGMTQIDVWATSLFRIVKYMSYCPSCVNWLSLSRITLNSWKFVSWFPCEFRLKCAYRISRTSCWSDEFPHIFS